jgi:hypothetical protein
MVELHRAAPAPRIEKQPIVPRQIAKPRAETPRIPPEIVQDLETVLHVAEALYHLPGGKNGKGAVGMAVLRLRTHFKL